MSKVRDMAEPMAVDLDRRDPNNLNEHLQVSTILHLWNIKKNLRGDSVAVTNFILKVSEVHSSSSIM